MAHMPNTPETDGDFVADGAMVRYHGTMTDLHGAWAVRRCVCRRCWSAVSGGIVYGGPVGLPARFELVNPVTGDSPALHVRRQSITLLAAA